MIGRTRRALEIALLIAFAVVTVSAASVNGSPPPAPPADPDRWCAAASAADQPDVVSAPLIHVVYAVPADVADRSSERALPILVDLAAIQRWWRSQDATRDLRLDVEDVPCDTALGRVDLSVAILPRDSAYYGDGPAGFERLTGAVVAAGLSAGNKKYLIYYDGPVQARDVCGTSVGGPPLTRGASVVYLDSLCGGDLGRAGEAAATAVHELLHNLGARPRLHPCAGSPAHVCDSPADILYPTVENGVALARLRLDVGNDDYYGFKTNAAHWWDVRDSPYLEQLGTSRDRRR